MAGCPVCGLIIGHDKALHKAAEKEAAEQGRPKPPKGKGK
jgi:hypothetical protein